MRCYGSQQDKLLRGKVSCSALLLKIMSDFNLPLKDKPRADGGTRWRVIYLAVVLFTVLVIGALWLFSRAFSS